MKLETILGIIEAFSIPIFGFFGPVLLDLLTRDNYGPLKINLLTYFVLLCSCLFYAYFKLSIHIDTLKVVMWHGYEEYDL